MQIILFEHEQELRLAQEKWKQILFCKEGTSYGIYQIRESGRLKDLLFSSWNTMMSKSISIREDDYYLVYAGTFGRNMILEDLYIKFNLYQPKDFIGHSLSVSDVVVLNRNGRMEVYYVDSFGFQGVEGFFKHPREMT